MSQTLSVDLQITSLHTHLAMIDLSATGRKSFNCLAAGFFKDRHNSRHFHGCSKATGKKTNEKGPKLVSIDFQNTTPTAIRPRCFEWINT